MATRVENTSKSEELRLLLRVPGPVRPWGQWGGEVHVDFPSEDFSGLRKVGSRSFFLTSGKDSIAKLAFAIRLDNDLDDKNEIVLKPGESLTLKFAFASSLDGTDYLERAEKRAAAEKDFASLLKESASAFAKEWSRTPVLTIPDERHRKLFYRSVYWLLSTAGSKRFLPGEANFATYCWNMRHFTYGAAGWDVFAFTFLGLPERARRICENHYKPAALKKNAERYLKRLTPDKKPPSELSLMAFPHESLCDGNDWASPKGRGCLQRHLDAFSVAFHTTLDRYYPNTDFREKYILPVLNGEANFWVALSTKHEDGSYAMPWMVSVSEDKFAVNPLDAAIAGKYITFMAAKYSEKYGVRTDRVAAWKNMSDHIRIPQNDKAYIQHDGLDRSKENRGGYVGYRSPFYLGFPCVELIKTFDEKKVRAALDDSWELNRHGNGMITFIASWFALADEYYGCGDHAMKLLERNFQCYPEQLAETSSRKPNPFFQTSYSAYVVAILKMFCQSYDSEIKPFPAIPTAWKNVAFHNIPAENGILVSGTMKDGKISEVSYSRGGKTLLRSTAKVVEIVRKENGEVFLRPKGE